MAFATLNILLALLGALLHSASADVYLHNPRGTNDRCDEKSENRQNERRVFDSQNNANAGYAICPNDMFFYEDTALLIQWTAQHGCGNGANQESNVNNPSPNQCQYVIQLGCEDAFGRLTSRYYPASVFAQTFGAGKYRLTEGEALGVPSRGDTCTQRAPLTADADCQSSLVDANTTTLCDTLDLSDNAQRATFNGPQCRCSARKMRTYPQHEPEVSYLKCAARERNRGLYTATQQLNGDTAVVTRQRPNRDRYGYECPEERDYFPYWAPTGFRDIAYLTTDTQHCDFVRANSENVQARGECVPKDESKDANPNDYCTNPKSPDCCWYNINEGGCTRNPQCKWVWQGPFRAPPVDCIEAPYTQTNNLGFGFFYDRMASLKDEAPTQPTYRWRVPRLDELGVSGDNLKCFIRLRYNISSGETGFFHDASKNNVLKQNPVICSGDTSSEDFDKSMCYRYAINTAQTGRTFEDRSAPFMIRRRTKELRGAVIHNLNVKGKRGNIAQVRNAMEYKFVPEVLRATTEDYVHFQVCGSDYNPDNFDGEGIRGTDRSNLVPLSDSPSCEGLRGQQLSNFNVFSQEDLAAMANIGQSADKCYNTSYTQLRSNQLEEDPRMCSFLNAASPYFSWLAKIEVAGSYCFASSRNNNFSNRDQKVLLNVDWATNMSQFIAVVAGSVAGGLAGTAALAGGLFVYMKRRREQRGHLLGDGGRAASIELLGGSK